MYVEAFRSAAAGPLVLFIIIIIVVSFIKLLRKIFQGKKSLIAGERKCSDCGRTLGNLDVNYCRYCGTKLGTAVPKRKRSMLGALIKIIIILFFLFSFIGFFASSVKTAQPSLRINEADIGSIKEIPRPVPINIETITKDYPDFNIETKTEEKTNEVWACMDARPENNGNRCPNDFWATNIWPSAGACNAATDTFIWPDGTRYHRCSDYACSCRLIEREIMGEEVFGEIKSMR